MNKPLPEIIHDLRNPLNTISMNAEVAILLTESDIDVEKLKKLMTAILKQCEQCGMILDQFDN